MDLERRADRAVHVMGVLLVSLASVHILWLVLRRAEAGLASALLPYLAGLVASFVCSALYNLAPPSPRREWLRRLDHAAIFLLIAGTYNALVLPLADERWAAGLLAVVWSLALMGVAAKLLLPRRRETWSIAFYLGLGWSFIAVADEAADALPRLSLVLIVAGGLFYTGGLVFHLLPRIRFDRAIWHSAVVAGAICHYAAIFVAVRL